MSVLVEEIGDTNGGISMSEPSSDGRLKKIEIKTVNMVESESKSIECIRKPVKLDGPR